MIDTIFEFYRPRELSSFIVSSHTYKSMEFLCESIKSGEIRSCIFSGPTGSGKTSFARYITSSVLQTADFIESDSASDRGIDAIRELTQYIRNSSLLATDRVLLLDEAHQLTSAAQNALLKSLEDLPQNNYIILCTTDYDGLIKTIKSRCYRIDFSYKIDDYFINKVYNLIDNIFSRKDARKDELVNCKLVVDNLFKSGRFLEDAISLRSLLTFIFEYSRIGEQPSEDILYFNNGNNEGTIQLARFICTGSKKAHSLQKVVSYLIESKESAESIRIKLLNYILKVYASNVLNTRLQETIAILSSISCESVDGKAKLIVAMSNIITLMK